MSIESNPQPEKSTEFKPYRIGPATTEEIKDREALLAADEVNYPAPITGVEAIPADSAHPTIEIPTLEELDANPPPITHADKLMDDSLIPQLEPERSGPRHRL